MKRKIKKAHKGRPKGFNQKQYIDLIRKINSKIEADTENDKTAELLTGVENGDVKHLRKRNADFTELAMEQESASVQQFIDKLPDITKRLIKRRESLINKTFDGVCGCGKEIGYARLMAVPHTTKCVACKDK